MFKDKVKVGQTIKRVMKGWSVDEPWVFKARVTNITDKAIECVVFADVPRTMEFDLITGVHLFGQDFGWLEVE